MRIHDVIIACSNHLKHLGRPNDVEAILAQFPDVEIEGDEAKRDLCDRIENAFTVQLEGQHAR